MPKINKNIIIVILIAAILVLAGIIGWTLFQKGKIPPQEEVIEKKTIEEILERLTPKEPKPLTLEEQEEQEKLLEQLTPAQPKPMTPEQQKEMAELLKELTPQ